MLPYIYFLIACPVYGETCRPVCSCALRYTQDEFDKHKCILNGGRGLDGDVGLCCPDFTLNQSITTNLYF